MQIKRLISGGLIVNYLCPSRCGHCLYACGPSRSRDYLSLEQAGKNIDAIRKMGCRSVHVGGGEPFLNIKGLSGLIELMRSLGLGLDYVETNSAWFRNPGEAASVLSNLRDAGLNSLLVSMSPFHNEHIPFYKVKGVIEACRRTGVGVFPWIPDFFPEIDSFDDQATHGPEEYESCFGSGYFKKLPSRYWVHYGGRALTTFSKIFPGDPAENVLLRNPGGCRELTDTSHFHVDLYGRYIPGLCSGLAVAIEDLAAPLDPDRYPVITVLSRKGISGLLDTARKDYGFEPQGRYINKCHLCTDIRRFLLSKGDFPELAPIEFYYET